MSSQNVSFVIDVEGPLLTFDETSFGTVIGPQTWSEFTSQLGGGNFALLRDGREMYAVLRRSFKGNRASELMALRRKALRQSEHLRIVQRLLGEAPCVITADCDPMALLAARFHLEPLLPNSTIVSSCDHGHRKTMPYFWSVVLRHLAIPPEDPDRLIVVLTESGDDVEIAAMEEAFRGYQHRRVRFSPDAALSIWQELLQEFPESAVR